MEKQTPIKPKGFSVLDVFDNFFAVFNIAADIALWVFSVYEVVARIHAHMY
jgi:hypothetical protein